MCFLPTAPGIPIEMIDGRLHFGDADLVISQELDMVLTDFAGFARHRSQFTGRAETFDMHAM
jgi:hypothetical protein